MSGERVFDPAPYDAILLLSFGGPEGPDDVVPFLENVTRGRGIPRERLEEVGKHYYEFGGRSPINDQNRAFLAALREDLAGHGIDLPAYWGNRNWHPYLADTLRQLRDDGVRRVACFATSAYASYSGCRQYRENLAAATAEVAAEGRGVPRIDKLRHYFNHPGFIEPMVDSTLAALAELPDQARQAVQLLFVTHSVPVEMNLASGRRSDVGGRVGGGAYVAQHESVAEVIAERVRHETGHRVPYELVYCSRSGPPTQAWLEPDVCDRIGELAQTGKRAVVAVPIGFVSDHMEVIYDLDVEAATAAKEAGIEFVRAATAGIDPRFVAVVRDLLIERARVERGESVERASIGVRTPSWDVCPRGCCANPRQPLPALCGGTE
ncbi:MAG: ferrochelatase [Nocardioidaceae bacterium]